MDSISYHTEGRKEIIIGLTMIFFTILFVGGSLIFAFIFGSAPQLDVMISENNKKNIRCKGNRFGKNCNLFGPVEGWGYYHLNKVPPVYEKLYSPDADTEDEIFRETSSNSSYKSLYIKYKHFYRSKDTFTIDSISDVNQYPIMIRDVDISEFLLNGMVSNVWTNNYHRKNTRFIRKNKLTRIPFLPNSFITPKDEKNGRFIISTIPYKEENFDEIFAQGNTSQIRIFREGDSLDNIPFCWSQKKLYIMYV